MCFFRKKQGLISYLLLTVLLFLIFPNIAKAQDVFFYDDFDSHRESWQILNQDWEVTPLHGDNAFKTTFSDVNTRALAIIDKDGSEFWEDYSAEGSFYSVNGVDQLIWVRVSIDGDNYSYYAVNLRAKGWVDSNNVRVKKVVNNSGKWMVQVEPPTIGCSIEHNSWYKVKVTVRGSKIEVYLGCSLGDVPKLIFSREDENPLTRGTVAIEAWSGSWSWGVEKFFDDIKISSLDAISSKVILLPGLGASWNTEAVLLGEKKPQNEWVMTPFVNVYDNLVDTLMNGGYAKDEDLFVFNYDWRQPIEETAQELKSFVDSNIGEGEGVNLVGHSLGGLVSRAYWQEHGEEKIDKIVTLGTPHQGVVQAYEALAGGKISDTFNWSSVALNILLRLRNPFYKTTAEILQEEAPILRYLSPTFEFIKKGRRIVPLNKLSFQNNWLSGANDSLVDLSKINFISGNTGVNVAEWLKVKSPSPIDKLLGLWPDGFPYRSFKGEGDQTVLLKSSYLPDKNPDIFDISHRHLPSSGDSIEKVLAVLDINTPVLTETKIYPRNNTLIFLVASPAILEVTDPSQQSFFSDSQGFVVIPNPQGGSYSVKLHGIGGGEYHLVAGQLFDSDNWSVYQGEIETGTDLIYKFNIDPDQPKENPLSQDEKERLCVALEEINHLQSKYPSGFLSDTETNVQQAISEVNSSDWEEAVAEVKEAIGHLFDFRKENSEVQPFNRSEEIISLLADVLSSLLEKSGGATYREAKNNFRKAQRQRSLAWRIIRLKKRRKQLDDILLISFKSGDDFINKTKQLLKDKDYSAVSAYSYAALSFFKEI